MTDDEKNEGDAKSRLVASTVALIATKGWRAATTRAIADDAGVNLALVNYYFGNKQALMLTALEAAMRELADEFDLDELAKDPGRVLEASVALLAHSPNDPRLRVLFEATLQARHDEGVRGVTATVLTEYRHRLARALAKGKRPTAKHQGRAAAILALLDGLFLHKLVDPEIDPMIAVESLRALVEQRGK